MVRALEHDLFGLAYQGKDIIMFRFILEYIVA
jgi:hypothetical protein